MSQLHFYVPDHIETQIRTQAQRANLPLSQYLAQLVKREVGIQSEWPEDYVALFSAWEGDPLNRPEPLVLETRDTFL